MSIPVVQEMFSGYEQKKQRNFDKSVVFLLYFYKKLYVIFSSFLYFFAL